MFITDEHYDVLYVIEQAKACAWYRCKVPAAALASLGYRTRVTSSVTEGMLRSASLIVFERPAHPHNIAAIKTAVAIGARVAVEVDDDLWHIDPTNPAHHSWGKGALSNLDESIRIADFATVTTEALARVIRPLNADVRILPNMLPAAAWPAERVRPERDRIIIGWAGSPTHFRDLALIKPVIEHTLDRYPNVEFHIAGVSHVPFSEHERIVSAPGAEIEHYASVVGGFDIGLCPVIDTRFNRAKSDLKALEYAMVGIPVVASDTDTYASLPREAGFLCKTPADWLRALRLLIERDELRERMGIAARAWAETRTADANVGLWEKAYGLC